MSKKDIDPNEGLAADAVLATDLADEKTRTAGQLEYFGGDVDDIDNFDAAGLDDGSDLDYVAPEPDADKEADDEVTDDTKDADVAEDSDVSTGDADEKDGEEEAAEETDDADADDDSEVKAETDTKPKGIPKHRFDEVNERRKTAEEENTRLKAQIEAAKPPEDKEEPFDFHASEKQYMDLLLDGDTESALAKREEIDAARESKWRSDTKTETRTELNTDAENSELVSISKQAEEMFDVFNPDHENYNQSMLDKVMTFMRGYEASGEMSRTDAFVAGLADVAEMYNLMPPEEDVKDDTKKPTGEKKVDPKKPELRKNAITPIVGEGDSSDSAGAVVPDIANMTDQEIDALPEKTLARMRGDFL